MADRPKAGDRFVVSGRRDFLTVAECHAATTDDATGITRYVVMTPAGSRWSLVTRPVADGVRWIGTALPADPEAPEF